MNPRVAEILARLETIDLEAMELRAELQKITKTVENIDSVINVRPVTTPKSWIERRWCL